MTTVYGVGVKRGSTCLLPEISASLSHVSYRDSEAFGIPRINDSAIPSDDISTIDILHTIFLFAIHANTLDVKAEAPVTPLPESGYLSNLAVNKERKATRMLRINPLTVLYDKATEHSDFATFYLQTIIHKKLLSALRLADSRQGASCVVSATLADLQQLSPMLTGQRALSFPMEEKKRRTWDCCKFQNSLKGAFTPDSLRCKDTT